MDWKLDSFSAQARAWEEELLAKKADSEDPLDPEELQPFGDLLEGLYSESGEYALRQLKKLRPYLRRRGVEVTDYDAGNAVYFDILPTKNEDRTLRPALLAGDKLLLAGRAAEHMN